MNTENNIDLSWLFHMFNINRRILLWLVTPRDIWLLIIITTVYYFLKPKLFSNSMPVGSNSNTKCSDSEPNLQRLGDSVTIVSEFRRKTKLSWKLVENFLSISNRQKRVKKESKVRYIAFRRAKREINVGNSAEAPWKNRIYVLMLKNTLTMGLIKNLKNAPAFPEISS